MIWNRQAKLGVLPFLINITNAFIISPSRLYRHPPNHAYSSMYPHRPSISRNMLPPDIHMDLISDLTFTSSITSTIQSSHILNAVETFDGSSIVDPVVVSNVFWNGLAAKIISVLIGQLLATLVFSVLVYFASAQLKNLGEFVSQSFVNQVLDKTSGRESDFDGYQKKTSTEQRRDDPYSASSSSSPRQEVVIKPDIPKLIACIAIDIIGSSSELVPILGEVTDIAWAPIAALSLKSIFGSNVVFALEFAEEILPFTDILPLATICWVIQTYYYESDVARALGLEAPPIVEEYPRDEVKDAIDVKGVETRGSNQGQNQTYRLPDSDRDRQ